MAKGIRVAVKEVKAAPCQLPADRLINGLGFPLGPTERIEMTEPTNIEEQEGRGPYHPLNHLDDEIRELDGLFDRYEDLLKEKMPDEFWYTMGDFEFSIKNLKEVLSDLKKNSIKGSVKDIRRAKMGSAI